MKLHSKKIELSKLPIDANSEVKAMLRELEGTASGNGVPTRGVAGRFILAGTKLAYGSKKAGARN